MTAVTKQDLAHLIRDKYDDDVTAVLPEDLERLAQGEPLVYVIGWIPFFGLRIGLESRPLIPRPETEWWTEQLIAHLHERFGDAPFSLLDLCAGSGAIGLAVLAYFPRAHVTFSELIPAHVAQIRKNIEANGLDMSCATFATGDLFTPLPNTQFDIVATNPPYIPSGRTLEASVTDFEPAEALYAGEDGLDLIRKIAEGTPTHLATAGELWIECDVSNIEEARLLLLQTGADTVEIRNDPYGRPRILVAYYC